MRLFSTTANQRLRGTNGALSPGKRPMKPGSIVGRGLYLLLILVRLYFALSPSYIHPDEHLQGPEVIAGDIFHWEVDLPWEFVSNSPIRSIFPLYVIYGTPLILIRALYGPHINSTVVFRALRLTFFLLSFANGRDATTFYIYIYIYIYFIIIIVLFIS